MVTRSCGAITTKCTICRCLTLDWNRQRQGVPVSVYLEQLINFMENFPHHVYQWPNIFRVSLAGKFHVKLVMGSHNLELTCWYPQFRLLDWEGAL